MLRSNSDDKQKMKKMIANEKSDIIELVYAATKASFNTRSPDGVERCVDVLNQLKSLSLSVKDILLSESIFRLESLKKHRNVRVRKGAQALFDSWHKTLNTQAGDNFEDSFKVGIIKLRLKLKKPLPKSLIAEGVTIKKTTGFLRLKKRDGEQSQTHVPTKIKNKETKNESLELMKTEDHSSLTHDVKKIEKKTYFLEPKNKHDEKERNTNLKPCSLKKVGALKQTDHKMCSVTTATAIPQRSRQSIKDKDRKDSENPKSAALKTKAEDDLKTKKKTEFLELLEIAKISADLANAKGILLGKADSSRCVEALTLLKRINITLRPEESRRIMEKLDSLKNHKDRKICNAASALLHLWRQRISDQQRGHSATNKISYRSL